MKQVNKLLLDALGWKPLKRQWFKAKAKMEFKTLNSIGPNCLYDLFTHKSKLINYDLRDMELTPFAKTQL